MLRRSLILISVLILGAGCGNSEEDRLIGVWSVDKERSKIPEVPPFIASAMHMDPSQLGLDVLQNTRLKLLSDHTFVLLYYGAVEGKWQYSKGRLVFKPNQRLRWPLTQKDNLDAKLEDGGGAILIQRETPIGDIVLRFRKTG